MVSIQEPELVTFYYSIVTLLILIPLFMRLLFIGFTEYSFLRNYYKGIFFMFSSFTIVSLSILYGQFDDAGLVVNVNEESVYATGYLLFFTFWVFGNNDYIKHVIRIPQGRKDFIRSVNYIINGIVIVSLGLFFYTSGLIPNIRSSPNYSSYVELIFLVLSQIAILLFIYFYRRMGQELKVNTSNLTKARILLIRYSLVSQILTSIFILIASALLFFFTQNESQDNIIEMVLFLFVNTVAIFSAIVLTWSLKLPNWLRTRFNITRNRFDKISELNQIEK